ncbi:MAG: ribosome-binding factor A [Myxococcota bacterium]|nr:ribosome-binding factor A [Myxococcota bacterium]
MKHRSSRRGGATASLESDSRTKKLCSQALQALSLALASATDPRLIDASLRDVVPHPDASCLLLVVLAPAGHATDVHQALRDAQPYLRRELAVEVNRKRAPELAFAVVPTLDEGVLDDLE